MNLKLSISSFRVWKTRLFPNLWWWEFKNKILIYFGNSGTPKKQNLQKMPMMLSRESWKAEDFGFLLIANCKPVSFGFNWSSWRFFKLPCVLSFPLIGSSSLYMFAMVYLLFAYGCEWSCPHFNRYVVISLEAISMLWVMTFLNLTTKALSKDLAHALWGQQKINTGVSDTKKNSSRTEMQQFISYSYLWTRSNWF